MTKRAFAIGCHPDDIEFMMAGTLLRLKEAGYEIHYMNVANGSCGTNQYNREDIVRIRQNEAVNAAKLAEAVFHGSITDDLDVLYERKTLLRLGAVVREVAPEIILTHYPFDYMEDHSNTCRLTVSAAFCKGMVNFPVDPHVPIIDQDVTVYHCLPAGLTDPLRRKVKGEMYVDVASLIEKKKQMLAMHESQKKWLDDSQGMDSYLITMENLCRDMGAMSGRFEYAEAWIRHSNLGFCAPDANPLRKALGEKIWLDPAFEASLG